MPSASVERLIGMTLQQAPSGRNAAGLWLAVQLRDNGYRYPDAEEVMRQYAAAVPQVSGKPKYTVREALSSLKQAYKKPAREPWAGNGNGGQMNRRDAIVIKHDLQPRAAQEEPDAESVHRFRKACRTLQRFCGSPAEAYLQTRGIPPELPVLTNVRYSPDWGKIGPAVVFPIRSQAGRSIAAVGRAIEVREGVSPHQTFGPRSHGVFATPRALTSECVAVVESPIDALSIAPSGLPALAVGGLNGFPDWLFVELAKRVDSRSRTVFVAFDADDFGAGDDAVPVLQSRLSLVRVKRLRPPCKDWNELLMAEGEEAVSQVVYQALLDAGITQALDDVGEDEWECI